MTDPIISVVTPLSSSGNRYIEETWWSLLEQREPPPWEWIVTPNHGGHFGAAHDPEHTRVVPIEASGVGAIKHAACALARGRYIVELDHDDVLEPTALAKIAEAFERGADVVYSDFAEFLDETRKANTPYRGDCGWTHYTFRAEAERFPYPLLAMSAPPVTPQNLRRVEWAPNHVRAWRRDLYERIGGHDRKLPLADDHDLMIRFWLAGARFHHIPEPLYLYRVHVEQATQRKNEQIQFWSWNVYERHKYALAELWADDGGLAKVDLCGGINPRKGYAIWDCLGPDEREKGGRVHVKCDLNGPWPYKDNSVGVLRASDALEHLRDPVHVLNEAFRVLAPGGWFFTHTPSTDGRGAFCDPTHVSFWNELSFRYYTDPKFARFIPAFRGRFHAARVRTFYPDEWHKSHRLDYVQGDLLAAKQGYEHMGVNRWEE